MLKVYLALGLALVVVGLSAVVQNKDVSTYRVWSTVDSVSVSPAEAEAEINRAWDLAGQRQSRRCLRPDLAKRHRPLSAEHRYPTLSRDSLHSQLRRREAIFERRLSLTGELVAGQPPYLIINNQVWAISYPAGGTDGVPMFEAQELMPAQVEQAGFAAGVDAAENVELRIRGVQAIGCDLPELYSRRVSAESVLLGRLQRDRRGYDLPSHAGPD